MRKIVLSVIFLVLIASSAIAAPCIGIGLSCVSTQYVRAVVIMATAITWGNADVITWGDATIIVEN